jgi:hypothetical protein
METRSYYGILLTGKNEKRSWVLGQSQSYLCVLCTLISKQSWISQRTNPNLFTLLPGTFLWSLSILPKEQLWSSCWLQSLGDPKLLIDLIWFHYSACNFMLPNERNFLKILPSPQIT